LAPVDAGGEVTKANFSKLQRRLIDHLEMQGRTTMAVSVTHLMFGVRPRNLARAIRGLSKRHEPVVTYYGEQSGGFFVALTDEGRRHVSARAQALARLGGAKGEPTRWATNATSEPYRYSFTTGGRK
jgi:hypothetical protein